MTAPAGGVDPEVRPGSGGPVLVAFAGLPGVGKTTLAARVGAALRAPVLPVDPVERALHRYGLTGDVPGMAAYGAVAGLAEVQLGLGLSVVVDAMCAAIFSLFVRQAFSHEVNDRGLTPRIGTRSAISGMTCWTKVRRSGSR